jgi:hypothetical protein
MPLRVKLAIGAFAGLALAWVLPKGGTPPVATPTPTPPGQLTAAEVPLAQIPAGVSFRSIDGVRVFLVRTGDSVAGFHGRATTPADGPIYWCMASHFESADSQTRYDLDGKARFGPALRDLDRIQVLVAAGRVTIFPHMVLPGAAVSGSLPRLDSSPCPASRRVG